MSDVLYQVRKLQKLQQACGVANENAEAAPAVDTSKMTPYEAGQFHVAVALKRVRDNIKELDGLGEGASQTAKSALSQQIRKDLMSIKKEAAEVKKAAQEEKRKEEYTELMSHITKTDQLYKARFRRGDQEELPSGGGGGGGGSLGTELKDLGQPMVSLRDDEEFTQFFEQTKQNDVKIDQAVDRISSVVSRLHQNALGIREELKVQTLLLNETEEKVDNVTAELHSLNKKLKKTIKEVDKDKMCMYVFCCLLLLGLAGGCYYVITQNK